MNVLVTGGAGFIGSHIVDTLVSAGHRVLVLDNLSTGREENINPGCTFFKKDVRDELDDVFEGAGMDAVIHHAAQVDVGKSVKNPAFDGEVNVLGTVNLLKACVKYGVRKIIYASSAAVYGEPRYLGIDEEHPIKPQSFYGISKYTPEHYIRVFSELYGLEYAILRYANVYGPRQDATGEGGVVAIFTDKLIKGEMPVIFGDGEQTRDFVFVKDVAWANLLALEGMKNETVNVSTGKAISVNELYDIIASIAGVEEKPKYGEPRKGDIRHSYLDNAKITGMLNWKPRVSLEEGLKETYRYYQEASETKRQIAVAGDNN